MATVEKRRQEMGDLRDRASVQAKMKSAIIDRLLEDLPEKYSQDEIQARGEVIYQYVEQQLQSTSHH
jgi:type I restriction enzyme R subunit